MKATVRQNRFGNWRGYIGGRFVREFPQERGHYAGNMQDLDGDSGSAEMPQAAREWMEAHNIKQKSR
jgi:hypothetical protein